MASRAEDFVRCPAAGGARIPPELARSQHHSFGGRFPPEILAVSDAAQQGNFAEMSPGFPRPETQLPLEMQGDGLHYPPESYVHPENQATCDTCTHRCMNF